MSTLIISNGMGVFMAFFYVSNPGYFPKTNLMLALLIAGLFATAFNALFALLAGAFARSGGEYLYTSRTLNPLLGAIAGISSFWFGAFWTCFVPYLALVQAVAPALKAFGAQTSTHWAITAGEWFTVPWHSFWVTTAIMVGATAIVCMGLNVFWQINRVVVILGSIAMVLIIALLAIRSHAAFVQSVNHYGSAIGFKNAYATTLAQAKASGLPHGFTWFATLGMLPIAITTFVLNGYMGGEIRRPRRTQLITGAGGSAVYYVIVLIIGALIIKTVGTSFNTSAAFLSLQHSASYGFDQSPIYTWYAFMLTSNWFLLLLIGVGLALMGLLNGPQQIIWGSRILFAWSLDRIVPDKVGWIWERTASPVVAIILSALAGELILVLWVHGTLTFFVPIIIMFVDYMIVSITGICIPFVKKTKVFWERSGNNYKIGRVPLITILGVISVIYWSIVMYYGLKVPALGATTVKNWIVSIGVMGVGVVYFIFIWFYRKHEGMDLRRTYEQLPPE